MPRSTPTDPQDQKLLDDVREFGWHCMNVLEEEGQPPFSYTIGLYYSFKFPELLIYGLSRDVSHRILQIAAEAAAAGRPLDLDSPNYDLFETYPAVFVQIPLSRYRDHLGFARWYYEGNDFPAFQVVWPSREGRFPWHTEANDEFRTLQPVLGAPAQGG